MYTAENGTLKFRTMTDHRMSVSLLNIVEPLDFRKELVVKPNIEYIKKEMALKILEISFIKYLMY